ncbi:hypothetical protein SNEBB_007241 [Seison nebaliae]|nr:hypothetical protein SNEBB_007241 [Seison nebaliae]
MLPSITVERSLRCNKKLQDRKRISKSCSNQTTVNRTRSVGRKKDNTELILSAYGQKNNQDFIELISLKKRQRITTTIPIQSRAVEKLPFCLHEYEHIFNTASRVYPVLARDIRRLFYEDVNINECLNRQREKKRYVESLLETVRTMQDHETLLKTLNEYFISFLQYNHTGYQNFHIPKKRTIHHLLDIGHKMIQSTLPIKCLEGTFVALFLTQTDQTIIRFSIGFKTKMFHQTFRHVVLGYYSSSIKKFGAFGLSRRSSLATKPCDFETLSDLLMDYIISYNAVNHIVLRLRVGNPISHEPSQMSLINWNGVTIYLNANNLEKNCNSYRWTKVVEKHSRFLRQVSRGVMNESDYHHEHFVYRENEQGKFHYHLTDKTRKMRNAKSLSNLMKRNNDVVKLRKRDILTANGERDGKKKERQNGKIKNDQVTEGTLLATICS